MALPSAGVHRLCSTILGAWAPAEAFAGAHTSGGAPCCSFLLLSRQGLDPAARAPRQASGARDQAVLMPGSVPSKRRPLYSEQDVEDRGQHEPEAPPAVQEAPPPFRQPCTLKGVASAAYAGALGYFLGFVPATIKFRGRQWGLIHAQGVGSASQLALMSGMYTAVHCICQRIRLVEDGWNRGVAGCSTGLVLGWKAGPWSALQSCAGLGLLSALIDLGGAVEAAEAACLGELQSAHTAAAAARRQVAAGREPPLAQLLAHFATPCCAAGTAAPQEQQQLLKQQWHGQREHEQQQQEQDGQSGQRRRQFRHAGAAAPPPACAAPDCAAAGSCVASELPPWLRQRRQQLEGAVQQLVLAAPPLMFLGACCGGGQSTAAAAGGGAVDACELQPAAEQQQQQQQQQQRGRRRR